MIFDAYTTEVKSLVASGSVVLGDDDDDTVKEYVIDEIDEIFAWIYLGTQIKMNERRRCGCTFTCAIERTRKSNIFT